MNDTLATLNVETAPRGRPRPFLTVKTGTGDVLEMPMPDERQSRIDAVAMFINPDADLDDPIVRQEARDFLAGHEIIDLNEPEPELDERIEDELIDGYEDDTRYDDEEAA